MNEKMMSVLSNSEFAEEAKGIKSAEDMQKLFAKYGVELELEEVYKFCEAVAKQMEKIGQDGEISEDDLEAVAGGFAITTGLVVLGVTCVGAAALGIYNGYQGAKRK